MRARSLPVRFPDRFSAFVGGGLAMLCAAVLAAPVAAQAPPAASQARPADSKTPPGPGREDEAMARARQAYEALPASDRRAIQDNLVWTGLYKGVVDGEFGRMTFNAMRAYTRKRPGAADGVLSIPDRAALAAEAAKARAAVDFRMVQDARAGFSIGMPQKVFVRRVDVANGARFETADKSAVVETFGLRESEGGLQAMFDALRAPAPNRRVTYSVLRPDFFVLTAETPTQATYTRVARGVAAGGGAVLRGFTMSWPRAQQARYETLSIAIANAFDPFGQKAALAKADPAAIAPPGGADGLQKAAPAILPPAPSLVSTAVALAPNRYVAILPDPVCNEARVGARPARLLRHEPATGLALFDVPGGAGLRLRAPVAAPEGGAAAVALFAAPGDKPLVNSVAAASGAFSDFAGEGKGARLIIYLPSEATGAVAFSRKGELVGLILPAPPRPQKLAGAPPPASRAILYAQSLANFAQASGLDLAPAKPNATDASAGKIAADHRASIEGLWCAPSVAPDRRRLEP